MEDKAKEVAEEKTRTLEEDDEFEDFPVDTWPDKETLGAIDTVQGDHIIWEENWDDVEADENFTNELKQELEKFQRK